MKTVLLLSLVILSGILLAKHLSNEPPLRGLAQSSGSSVLASRARPSVSFEPAHDMRLLTSGWCSVSPATRHSTGGDARVSMVLYENGKGTLITTLAEAEGQWQWEAAHHCPFPVLRQMKESQNNETLHESLYVLEAARDPFRSVDRVKGPGVPTEHAACMVYRAKMVMDFRNMQVAYEYHEPLEHGRERDIAYDLPLLNAFEKRGREACHICCTAKRTFTARCTGWTPWTEGFRVGCWGTGPEKCKDAATCNSLTKKSVLDFFIWHGQKRGFAHASKCCAIFNHSALRARQHFMHWARTACFASRW